MNRKPKLYQIILECRGGTSIRVNIFGSMDFKKISSTTLRGQSVV